MITALSFGGAEATASIVFTGDAFQNTAPDSVRVGNTGTGALTVDGGSVLLLDDAGPTFDPSLIVGRHAGSSGTVNITGAGSTIRLEGNDFAGTSVQVGRVGTGQLNISNTGSTGGLFITDPGASDNSATRAETFYLGREAGGTGTLVMNAGRLEIDSKGSFFLMGRDGSSGTATIQNNSVVNVLDHGGAAPGNQAEITVGRNGGGLSSFTVTNSEVNVISHNNQARFKAGRAVGGTGVASFGTGADILVKGFGAELHVGDENTATGQILMTGGAQLDIEATGSGGRARIQLGINDGSTGTMTITNDADVRITSVNPGDSDVLVGAAFTDFGRAAGGNGILTVTGAGSTLTLTDSLIVGAPVVGGGGGSASGVLTVADGAVITSGRVVIGAGGILTGSGGTINANVELDGGIISPGSSPGDLRIFGDFTFRGGTFVLEVEELAGGGFATDRVIFDNSASIDLSGADIVFSFLGETDPSEFLNSGDFNLDTFLRVDNGGTEVALSTVRNLPTVLGAATYSAVADSFVVTQFAFDPAAGVQTLAATTAPEPAVLALLSTGLLGVRLFGNGRRKVT